MNAAEVKDALRRRHPAQTIGSMTGQWVCIEEWENIDLIALNAWADADVVGYEVKVSRGDYRQELLAPNKRKGAVETCTEFYFAVPKGLLKPDEIAYEEPDWLPGDWHRTRCPGIPTFGPPDEWQRRRHEQRDLLDAPPGRYGGPCRGRGQVGSFKAGRRERGPFTMPLPVPFADTNVPDYATTTWERVEGSKNQHGIYKTERVSLAGVILDKALRDYAHQSAHVAESSVQCPNCDGKGYLARSRVEAEAPTLWVPRDVGLIEVDGRGCRVVRKSPKRRDAPGLLPVEGALSAKQGWQWLAQLIRWTSNHPDPRHVAAFAEAA